MLTHTLDKGLSERGAPFVYGSVCSGIEAASCAWHPLGWRAAFLSEIEPFPRAILAHHWPETPLHGDFTTIQAGDYEPIDLLVGGTPCQSFSVAGLRGGLDDDRGNLALEYLRLADRLRPRWLVWENVPGVLSSNGGRDFGSILGGMGELGYGVAYRVLDAQFFGLAQRRRRVFVVGYLGDWRRAAAVLFERHSLSGHPAPSRETGEGTAPSPSLRARASSSHRADSQAFIVDVAPTMRAGGNSTGGDRPYGTDVDTCESLIAHSLRGEGFDASEDGTVRGTPLIPVAYRTTGNDGAYETGDHVGSLTTSSDPNAQIIAFSSKDYGGDAEVDLSPTLRAGAHDGSHANAGVPPAIAYGITRDALDRSGEGAAMNAAERSGLGITEELAQTLKAKGPGAVAFALRGREGGAMLEVGGAQVGALRSASGGSSRDYVATSICLGSDPIHARELAMPQTTRNGDPGVVQRGSAVRRLTPRECERLQGFPDDYTAIPWRKGVAADGPRYKALGNSMAVPCMSWIGRRIQAVDNLSSQGRAV